MMKKLKAFTLSEMLVVICIIAVIAALMISTLGNKVDRNKGLFKKAYSVTERTVVELVNDETYYPYDYEKFGFKEDTDVKIIGPDYYTSTTNYSSPITTKQESCDKLTKFCNLFSNNLNLNTKPKFNGTTDCTFETTDGIIWKIEKSEGTPVNGFLITIDTNGTKKEPNKPSSISNVSKDKEGETKNRDVFYMYIRDDGKMELPEDDKIAKEYLKSSDMNSKEKKDGEEEE